MDKLIAGEFAKFFEEKKGNYSNDKSIPSEFQVMVLGFIRSEMDKAIREKVTKAVFSYVDEKNKDDQITKDIVSMITPTVFASMMSNVAATVTDVLRQQINSGYNNGRSY